MINYREGALTMSYSYTGNILHIDLTNKRLRYELMGWDPDNGIPTPAKLIELDLDWLIGKVK